MTTPHKNAGLIHAFADGKTLQFKSVISDRVYDWDQPHCPDFDSGAEWRIKPAEPKKVLYLAFESNRGHLSFVRAGSVGEKDYDLREFKRAPELDREVTLPTEGE